MRPPPLNPPLTKAFWSGMLFLAIGIGGLVFGWDLPRGRAAYMGPGFFPTILCFTLCLIGLTNLAKSFLAGGDAVEIIKPLRIFIVLLGLCLFGLLINRAGLGIAAFVLVFVTACAAPDRNWRDALLLALGLGVASIALFVLALGLPLRVWL